MVVRDADEGEQASQTELSTRSREYDIDQPPRWHAVRTVARGHVICAMWMLTVAS